MKKWIVGLFALLSLLAMSPVFSQDTGFVKVDIQDWEKIQLYYQTSQKELKELSSKLGNLQNLLEKSKTELTTSLNQAETLRIYLNESTKQIQSLEKRNHNLKITLGITSGISIGLILTGIILILCR